MKVGDRGAVGPTYLIQVFVSLLHLRYFYFIYFVYLGKAAGQTSASLA
jgi:hypothetical protein